MVAEKPSVGGKVSGFGVYADSEGQSMAETVDLGEEAQPRRSQGEESRKEGICLPFLLFILSEPLDLSLPIPHSLGGLQWGWGAIGEGLSSTGSGIK